MNRCVVYGPCSLSTVSLLSCGISGISTEKCPSGEVNFTQPLVAGVLAGAGVLVGVLDGRPLCSWALSVKQIAVVIMASAKNLFIYFGPPFEKRLLGRQIITVDRRG